MAGNVGVSPGTLTVQVPYATPVELMGARLGMVDLTKRWNYGRDDGRSPQPVQPMFQLGPGGKITGLSGLGQPQLQLLGRAISNGMRSSPNLMLMGRADSPPTITLTGGRVVIPRPTLLGQPGDVEKTERISKRAMKITIIAGLASIVGGIAGAAIGAGKGRRADAAGGAAIGSLLGPIGTAAGAAIGAGPGRRLRAGGAAVAGSVVAGLAAGVTTYFMTSDAV